eukprot:3564568-Pleurochrysis_carterae.AAC.1
MCAHRLSKLGHVRAQGRCERKGREFSRAGAHRALREGDVVRARRVECLPQRRQEPDQSVAGMRWPPRHASGIPAVRWVLDGPRRPRPRRRFHELRREVCQLVVLLQVVSPPGSRPTCEAPAAPSPASLACAAPACVPPRMRSTGEPQIPPRTAPRAPYPGSTPPPSDAGRRARSRRAP